jgi:rhodanese-related sulfurtransferase
MSTVATRVDIDRMLELVEAGAELVDVLPSAMYAEVHLPGARSLPLATLTRADLAEYDLGHPVVLYCFDQH